MYKRVFVMAKASGFVLTRRLKSRGSRVSMIFLDQIDEKFIYFTIHSEEYTNTCRVTILPNRCNFQLNIVVDQAEGEWCKGINSDDNFVTDFFIDDFNSHLPKHGSIHNEDIDTRLSTGAIMTVVNNMIYNEDNNYGSKISSEIFASVLCSIESRIQIRIAKLVRYPECRFYDKDYIHLKIYRYCYTHYASLKSCPHNYTNECNPECDIHNAVFQPCPHNAKECDLECKFSMFRNCYGPIDWKQYLDCDEHRWSNYNNGSINRYIQEIR